MAESKKKDIYILVLLRIFFCSKIRRIYSLEYSFEMRFFIFIFFPAYSYIIRALANIFADNSILFFEKLEIFEFVRFHFFLSGNIRIRSNVNGCILEYSRIWEIIKNLWDKYSKWQNLLHSLEYFLNFASNIGNFCIRSEENPKFIIF